jgi:hypothetical protein
LAPVSVKVARGPGPTWLRWGLVAVAALYFLGLLIYSPGWKTVPDKPVVKPIAFFLEAAGLFPKADEIAFEYRLEGWSCARRRWEKLDPRPYFPIEADNKESRFQRLVWFFRKSANYKTIMSALDDYVVARHEGVDDAIDGPLGGIRVYEVWRDLPPPGAPTDRYAFHPVAMLGDGEHRKDVRDGDGHRFYFTPKPERGDRCKAANAAAP